MLFRSQLGLIKLPRQYNSSYDVTKQVANACWTISATTSTIDFAIDSVVTMNDSKSSKFRIAVNTGMSLLLIALDGGVPDAGNTFTNTTFQQFTAAAVQEPSVDKYSGSLMFIDNKRAFTPSLNQTVTLKTTIQF